MNEKQRQKLRSAIRKIDEASAIVGNVSDREYDTVSNYPENLQNTERFERMEENADTLSEVVDDLNAIVSTIESVISA